jgi:hypothetical protein
VSSSTPSKSKVNKIPSWLLVVLICVGTAVIVVSVIFHQNAYCAIEPTNQDCYYPGISYVYDGIIQLYAHNPNGALWSLESNPDAVFNSGSHIAPVGNGWYTNTGSAMNNIRNEVPSQPDTYKRGYVSLGGFGPYNQQEWRQAGYMDTPKDWRNIEMSGIFWFPTGTSKAPGTYGPGIVDMVMRGGVNADQFPATCQATNYHVGYSPIGDDYGLKLERDIEHTNGYCAGCYTGKDIPGFTYVPLVGLGHPFGFKVALYNNAANTAVRIDAYLDVTGTGHHWMLMYTYIDKGGDPMIDSNRGPIQCTGANPNLPITWGGPLSGYRINWAGAFFRQLTISEIIPPRW